MSDIETSQKRFMQEVGGCQVMLQYLEEIYSGNNKDLLNQAPHFFMNIYDLLVNNLCLKTSRLFDPAKSGKNKNFSINYLRNLRGVGDISFNSQQEISFKNIRSYRRQYLAHNDLKKERVDFESNLDIVNHAKNLLGLAWLELDEITKVNYNGSFGEFDRRIRGPAQGQILHTLKRALFLGELLDDTENKEVNCEYMHWVASRDHSNKT